MSCAFYKRQQENQNKIKQPNLLPVVISHVMVPTAPFAGLQQDKGINPPVEVALIQSDAPEAPQHSNCKHNHIHYVIIILFLYIIGH